MAYEPWEREHDENLVETLSSARFVEEDRGSETVIKLAHLCGRVWFCDGVMYWGLDGHCEIGGEKPVNQSDIDRSAAALLNYGRTAVKNNLDRIAEKVIASAKRRLEQNAV